MRHDLLNIYDMKRVSIQVLCLENSYYFEAALKVGYTPFCIRKQLSKFSSPMILDQNPVDIGIKSSNTGFIYMCNAYFAHSISIILAVLPEHNSGTKPRPATARSYNSMPEMRRLGKCQLRLMIVSEYKHTSWVG